MSVLIQPDSFDYGSRGWADRVVSEQKADISARHLRTSLENEDRSCRRG